MSTNENEKPAELTEAEEGSSKANFTVGSIVSVLAIFMFIGGALVTLLLFAKSCDLHGQALAAFVIASCSLVLGLAGYLITNIVGDKPVIGMFIGAMFGGFSAFVLWWQTKSYSWWQ